MGKNLYSSSSSKKSKTISFAFFPTLDFRFRGDVFILWQDTALSGQWQCSSKQCRNAA